jgi:hypothetical protein
LPERRTRSGKGGSPIRSPSVLLMAFCALALSACGGGENEVEPRPDTRPTIESAVAERLARRSDKVASLLEGGDACRAKDEAARLHADLSEAVNNRDIPELYLDDLAGAVNELEAQIPFCEVMQPPSQDTNGENKGEKKKKKKKKKHDDEGQGDD